MISDISCLAGRIAPTLLGLFGFGFIICFHEFGHYLFARLFGVSVPRFSIGMGPQLISFTRFGTLFSISAIPVGGFVEIPTENPDLPNDPTTFNAKPYWQKLLIMFGGIICNVLLGIVLYAALFTQGMPKKAIDLGSFAPVIEKVAPSLPAEKAGLKEGDQLLTLNETPVGTIKETMTFLQSHKGKTVEIRLSRNGQEERLPITITEQGRIGVVFAAGEERIAPLNLMQAVIQGTRFALTMFWDSITGMYQLFTGKQAGELVGPVSILAQMVKDAKKSIIQFLLLVAIISIKLAALNLIPIPIFDGGQILTVTIEAVIRRRLPEKILYYIHVGCWALAILLFAFLTIKDLRSLLGF